MRYPVHHFLGSQRNGVNHTMMANVRRADLDGPTLVRGTRYPIYSDALLDWYKINHVKCVRLTFAWEAVQETLVGPVPSAGQNYALYWDDLAGRQVAAGPDARNYPQPVSVLKRLLDRDIYVILAPWQYNSALNDTDIVYDDQAFNSAQFADFWGKFAEAINRVTRKDQRVAFDLINEPHEQTNRSGDVGVTLQDWFAHAQAAITAIRNKRATNTIFVPGMNWAAASAFVTNGSEKQWLKLRDPQKNIAVTVHCYTGLLEMQGAPAKGVQVLRGACTPLVNWARKEGVKVNVGEIALDAGPNGRPVYCTGSTFAHSQLQWADWNNFCIANSDVIVGWNWWANSAGGWWNQGDSCDPQGHHWALSTDDGATETVYMKLIKSSIPAPLLHVRDNAPPPVGDSGAEPNVTTSVAWESPDIWLRQRADGVQVSEPVLGGQRCVVYVQVTNRGLGPYPGGANDVVRLYWAKGQMGLSWPAPWDGSGPSPVQGGLVAWPPPIGPIPPGQSVDIQISWRAPDPFDFPVLDEHFCILAFVTKATSPEFEGFQGPNLNQNVLRLSNVAWRNIHIVPVVEIARPPWLGAMVAANHTDQFMSAQVAFEILDAAARPADAAAGRLLITPHGAALEKIRQHEDNRPFLEDLGEGTFGVLDLAAGIPRLDLRPEEELAFGLEYVPGREAKGYVVRATQFSVEGAARKTIGGQTFVAGEVEGFTKERQGGRGCSWWPWLTASGAASLLTALLGRGRKKR